MKTITGLFVILFFLFSVKSKAQEVVFFTDGTNTTFYDQGIVDKANLGSSTFEFTYPLGLPQFNDKVPCSATAFKGNSALKFNYFSSANGNWKASIYRSDWSSADISMLDSLSFYVYSESEIPASALPLLGFRAVNKSGSSEVSSVNYPLGDYNNTVPAGKWTRIKFPLSVAFSDAGNQTLDFTKAKGIILAQSEKNNTSRLIFIDEIKAFKSILFVPPVTGLTATGYDCHAELIWTKPANGMTYRIYASFDGISNFRLRGETTEDYYLDFVTEEGKNKTVNYKVVTAYQQTESVPAFVTAQIHDFTDDELLDMFEQYTFRYFWEGSHQATGMALERTNGGASTVASGATGMGLMAMIVAYEREYRPREVIKDRILSILNFLETCDRHHGAWSHWYNADTGKTQPFSTYDDGGDLVETSYVVQGLIALKNYFTGNDAKSVQIRENADHLWKSVEWDWYRQGNQNVLYWHWSPNYNWQMNMKITGWSECLIAYIMAASSPTFGIPKEVYTLGWARNGNMVNKRTYYGYPVSLSPDWGGPLFWIHYSFLGLNPNGLKDQYADYWTENVNTAKIHVEYAKANPKGHLNYSAKNWGLTASDDPYGYTAHQPVSNDNGTISPTAALASFPYTPDESMTALKYFYRERGKDIFGKYGTYDAFNDNVGWVQKAYLGIDQGPIVVMIENFRTGLLWNMVMKDSDLKSGLEKLGFEYKSTSAGIIESAKTGVKIYPNPATNSIILEIPDAGFSNLKTINIFSANGVLFMQKEWSGGQSETVDISGFPDGLYFVQVLGGQLNSTSKLIIKK